MTAATRALRALTGPLEGAVFPVGARTILGRSGEADIQILSKEVSRVHACLFEDDYGQMVLMDMSSRNGIYVGETRIAGQHVLHPGDSFRIGESELVLVDSAEPGELDEDMELKLVSGRAEENTFVDARVEVGCGHEMHFKAVTSGWPYCPVCGQPATEG